MAKFQNGVKPDIFKITPPGLAKAVSLGLINKCDSSDSRARCFSLVQCVRTAQSREALQGARWPLSVRALLNDSAAVKFSALVWGLAHRQHLRLGPDLRKWDLGVAGDCCPRGPGPMPQPAVPFRPRHLLRDLILAHSLVRSSMLQSRKSAHQNPLASLRRSHTLVMAEKKRRSCQDIQIASAGGNGSDEATAEASARVAKLQKAIDVLDEGDPVTASFRS